jgi:hypothetical protein
VPPSYSTPDGSPSNSTVLGQGKFSSKLVAWHYVQEKIRKTIFFIDILKEIGEK